MNDIIGHTLLKLIPENVHGMTWSVYIYIIYTIDTGMHNIAYPDIRHMYNLYIYIYSIIIYVVFYDSYNILLIIISMK